MLIYLCDDSRSDILRLKHYLDTYARKMNLTFEPVSFSSSEELLDAFRQNRQKPDLIFLDIFMSNDQSFISMIKCIVDCLIQGVKIAVPNHCDHHE